MGEASGFWEIFEGTVFAGASGGTLSGLLQYANLTRLDVSIMNPIQCRPITWVGCDTCDAIGEVAVDHIKHVTYDAEDVPLAVSYEAILETCPNCAGEGTLPDRLKDGDHRNLSPPEPKQIEECMTRYGYEILKSSNHDLLVALGGSALYALTGRSDLGDQIGFTMESEFGRVFITYHPSFVMQTQHMRPTVQRHFRRIPGILSGVEGKGLDVSYKRSPSKEEINGLSQATSLAGDLETTGGLDPDAGGDILCASFSPRVGESYIVRPGPELERVLSGLDEVVGQYFYSYDAWWLHKRGYTVPPVIVDTQVLGHLANPSTPNDIGFLQNEYGEPPMGAFWKSSEHYEDKESVALRDTDATKRIEHGLFKHFDVTGQRGLAEDVIIPWCYLAFELRRDGIRCDYERLRNEADRIHNEVWTGGAKLAEDTGCPMPKTSKVGLPGPKNIQHHLYYTLGLPRRYHRKTTKLTADEGALRVLRGWCVRNGHAEGKHFIETLIGRPCPDTGKWLPGLKQLSTLGKDYAKYAKYESEWLHAEPNLTGTKTGRLSYTNPNLQQVPPKVRKAFLPDPGQIFIQFDYKQIEFLVMLYMSRQFELLGLGLAGQDFHTMAAQHFFNIQNVNEEQRKAIKPIDFGIIYGKGTRSTAEDLGIPEGEAVLMYNKWFEMVPGLTTLRQELTRGVQDLGYYQSPHGWRRYFSKEEREHTHYKSTETEIYNTPIQSTAGLHTREALVWLRRELNNASEAARLVLTVHDSGLLSCPPEDARKVVECIQEVVTQPCRALPCPEVGMPDGIRFPIDIEWGRNWGEMKKWDTFKDPEPKRNTIYVGGA
jgi:DNA polymerase I-like protein with 3'-5' exonuclease and polymerase domains/uracil-DNA glycosylase